MIRSMILLKKTRTSVTLCMIEIAKEVSLSQCPRTIGWFCGLPCHAKRSNGDTCVGRHHIAEDTEVKVSIYLLSNESVEAVAVIGWMR